MSCRANVTQGLLGCAWILWASGWVDSAKVFHVVPTYVDAFAAKEQCQAALTGREDAAAPQGLAPAYRCVPSDVPPDQVFSRRRGTP